MPDLNRYSISVSLSKKEDWREGQESIVYREDIAERLRRCRRMARNSLRGQSSALFSHTRKINYNTEFQTNICFSFRTPRNSDQLKYGLTLVLNFRQSSFTRISSASMLCCSWPMDNPPLRIFCSIIQLHLLPHSIASPISLIPGA